MRCCVVEAMGVQIITMKNNQVCSTMTVLPENAYYLIFLTFFRGNVNLVSSVIVATEEDPEP